jgi:DNA replication initiation complex subunit (GINS family)
MCNSRPNTEKASPEIRARSNPQKTHNQIEKKHRPGKKKKKKTENPLSKTTTTPWIKLRIPKP